MRVEKLRIGEFNQRITEHFELAGKISSIAVAPNGDIYACSEKGLCRFKDGEWNKLFSDGVFTKVYCHKKGGIFASLNEALYEITSDRANKIAEFEFPIVDLCGENEIYVLTQHSLHVKQGEDFFTLQKMDQDEISLAVQGEKVCVASKTCLQRMEGKRRTWRCIFPAYSASNSPIFSSIATKLRSLL